MLLLIESDSQTLQMLFYQNILFTYRHNRYKMSEILTHVIKLSTTTL